MTPDRWTCPGCGTTLGLALRAARDSHRLVWSEVCTQQSRTVGARPRPVSDVQGLLMDGAIYGESYAVVDP